MDSIVDFLQSTMLIERLCGVGTYALMLGYFFNKVKYARNLAMLNKYLNCYLFILCIMAFLYIPAESADLYRWRAMSEAWINMDLDYFIEKYVLTSSVPIAYLFIYLSQSTGIDGLLPMLCAFGFFGNIFHMIKCESKLENANADSVAVTLLFIMSTGVFLEVISGVRCMLAFSIVARCAYDEMRKKKNVLLHIPLYIIAILLHTAAIPLVGMRLACMFFEKKKNPILTVVNLFLGVISILMALHLGSDYIDAAFKKAEMYTSQDVYSYVWEYIIACIAVLLLFLVLYKFKSRYPNKYHEMKNSWRYLLLILIYDVLFFSTYTIFQRFFTAGLICSVPIVMNFFNCENVNARWKMRKFVIFVLLIIIVIACSRGNLSGYKFFYLG